jgi:hypothetical protein
MHFNEFIMPSTVNWTPRITCSLKTSKHFLEGILHSAEDAPLSLVHHFMV